MPANSLTFTAVLKGGTNATFDAFGPGVQGMKSYQKRLLADGQDSLFMADYQELVDALGMRYMDEVRQAFAAKHGRSGDTAESMRSEFSPVALKSGATGMRYSITIEGNVGYVLNPLPFHWIYGSYFRNPQDQHEGRTENFFSPFEYLTKAGAVPWFQGGGESFSPDRSWYEDQIPELEIEARRALHGVAQQVQMMWSHPTSP